MPIRIPSEGEARGKGDLLVRWVWNGEERVGRLDDKWAVRTVTIYEEHHPEVQARIMDLLLGSG
jgi:hypothetical protein